MRRGVKSWVVKGLVATVVCALPVVSYGITIQSADIVAADGTSGQNLTGGYGVKTGHIQNGAVTDAKISGTISGSKLGAHGHNAGDISGTINVSNLPVGSTAGTVAAGDHSHDSLYQKKYANVIVVAKSGGDFTDPVAAVASITDASATNTYLVKIMPGTYSLSANSYIAARSYVDIEGSGRNATKIVQPQGAAVVQAASITNSEIRNLSLEISPYAPWSDMSGIKILTSEFQAQNIQINLVNGNNSGATGVNQLGSKTVLKDIKVTISGTDLPDGWVTGFAVQYDGALAQIENVVIEALVSINGFNGVYYGGNVPGTIVRNLRISGVDFGNINNNGASVGTYYYQSVKFYDSELFKINVGSNNTLFAVNSMIDSLGSSTAHFKCVNCYNQNFDPINLNQ